MMSDGGQKVAVIGCVDPNMHPHYIKFATEQYGCIPFQITRAGGPRALTVPSRREDILEEDLTIAVAGGVGTVLLVGHHLCQAHLHHGEIPEDHHEERAMLLDVLNMATDALNQRFPQLVVEHALQDRHGNVEFLS